MLQIVIYFFSCALEWMHSSACASFSCLYLCLLPHYRFISLQILYSQIIITFPWLSSSQIFAFPHRWGADSGNRTNLKSDVIRGHFRLRPSGWTSCFFLSVFNPALVYRIYIDSEYLPATVCDRNLNLLNLIRTGFRSTSPEMSP
jgi:hypothetical protein